MLGGNTRHRRLAGVGERWCQEFRIGEISVIARGDYVNVLIVVYVYSSM